MIFILPFYNHTYLTSFHPSPFPLHAICLPLVQFYHFKMLHKWIHTLHNILDWLFSLSIYPSRVIEIVACIKSFFFSLYCWVVSHEIYVPQLPVLLLKGWDHSSSWALQITLLWTLCTGFYCGCKFSFLWDTLPRMQLLCPMVPVCLVL